MPEPSSRVGVAVLNYRGADDTIACVGSLQRLRTPARVIVVDNGSGDGSTERIRDAFPDIDVIANAENLGFAAGNNVAIERLLDEGAEFVWVLNNDTTVEETTLDELLAAADEDPAIGAVGAVIYAADRPDDVLTWGGGSVSTWTGRTRDARSAADGLDYLTGASMLIRADALRAVGAFDDRYFFTWEDVDLGLRLRTGGWRIAVADRARLWHRWGATVPPTSPRRLEEHAAGLVTFMRSHSPVPWLTALPMLGWYALTAMRQRDAALWAAAWRGWRKGWRT